MKFVSDQSTHHANHRVIAIDILRGAVIVLMALDHTRFFFSNVDFSPTDLSKTSVSLFLTRWITHFCAPVFIFLAGTGAYLSAVQHPGKWRLSGFLFKRGVLILFLGITFESLIWNFTPDFSVISGTVLWAIGWSMVVLAGLVFLPTPIIVAFGLSMIGGHNLFDGLTSDDWGDWGYLWAILHSGETVRLTDQMMLRPLYPLIPWIGVMAVGYGFGRLMLLEKGLREKALFALGSVMILLFISLRYTNYYGDPEPWTSQGTMIFTMLSFINCEKYPPSLLYLLMTLGPAIMMLPLLERGMGWFGAVMVMFGRAPMCFYLLHLPFIALLALTVAFVTNSFVEPTSAAPIFPEGFPRAYGYGLPVVYSIWVGIVIALYPVCRWYYGYKRQGRYAVLKYL